MNDYFAPLKADAALVQLSELSKAGYWSVIKMMSPPDVTLRSSDGIETAKIHQRYSDIRVWWANGPAIYVITYAHSITCLSASTDIYWLKLKWLNQGGGLEKVEDISDHVSCRDTSRRMSWTFGTTELQQEIIQKFSTEIFGETIWDTCAK